MSLVLSIVWSGLCLFGPEAVWQGEVDRLIGQSVDVSKSGYHIVDIAGEGEPHVGCVRRVGHALFLESGAGRFRLTGPLALPRIAGPNYKVWVIGTVTPAKTLRATRLGILAPPEQSICGVDAAAL